MPKVSGNPRFLKPRARSNPKSWPQRAARKPLSGTLKPEAEAKATQFVSDAVSRGDINALNYFIAQKYVEALGRFAEGENQKTLFLPLDATNLIGAIGGIAEIARDAMEQRSVQKSAGPWGGSDEGDS